MTGSRQNLARSGARLRLDFNRIAKGLSRPGIDPRSWVVMARVDNDPDAIVWDATIGWIVDVTFLDGDGPVTCRVVSDAQGQAAGSIRPVRPDSLVLVLIPTGDPNYDAIIVGELHDADANIAPTTINTDAITEEFAASTHIDAFPTEDLDQEWANVRITASTQMILGVPLADQSYVRGDDYADALDAFADALDAFAQAIAVAPVNIAGAVVALDPASLTLFQTAISQYKAARTTYLSTRIKGD